jgi:hypothetical protein
MPDDPDPPPPKLLRCLTCGKTLRCSDETLLAYVGIGWPVCCGEAMALLTASGPVGPWDPSSPD